MCGCHFLILHGFIILHGFLFFTDNLNDALGRSAIPSVRNASLLPFALHNLLHRQLQLLRIFSYQLVRTHGHRFQVLGVTVERDARHTIEGSLLSHIARIRDHTHGMGSEIREVEIALRLHHHDARTDDQPHPDKP